MTKKSSFRGKTKTNASQRQSGNSFNHLNIPKGLTVFVPEPNTKVVLDILPYKVKMKNHPDKNEKKEIAIPGEIWYKLPFKTHGNIGVGKDKHKEVCPTSIGKKCPICELYEKERKKGDLDEEELKLLKTSRRNLYFVIVRTIDGKRQDPKIQLFEFSDFLFQEEFEKQLGDTDEFDYFPDLEEGVSLKITFGEGSYANNKYAEPTRFDWEPRKKQYGAKFISQIPCLDDCLNVLSYEDLKEAFESGGFESDEDDDEDERPSKKGKAGKKRRHDDDDDDEEEDDIDDDEDFGEEDDDDEEDEEDDDDEEDEEDDEEDEDDEPVRKQSKKFNKKPTKPAKKVTKKQDDKCEYGHKFGKDYGKFEDCDDCEIAKQCKAAKKAR